MPLYDDEGRELADSPALAKQLGVTTNQVYMWNQRWERNGFPAPTHHREHGSREQYQPKAKFLWVLEEVLEWHRNYVPPKGGRKRKQNDESTDQRRPQDPVLIPPGEHR